MPIRRKGGKQLVMPNAKHRSMVFDINVPGRYRVSVAGPLDSGGPPIPARDFLFYYSCDWSEGNRAPEIGQGVQQESNAAVTLISGQVGLAVRVGFQPLSFQTEGNLDLNIGTLGFWWRKQEFNATTSLPSMFRENGGATTWRVTLVGAEAGIAGNQPTMRFRWATDAEHIAVPPGEVGDWVFVEVAWDFANRRTAMRFNGGDWDQQVWPVLTQGDAGGQWTLGIHQTKAGYTDVFDQVFITDSYQYDIHQYRFSREVEYTPSIPERDFLFYYSCDWTDGNRAPEIGQGVQAESASNAELVEGQVNEAIFCTYPSMTFQSEGNVNLSRGTLGFWLKKRTVTGMTSLPSVFRESGGSHNLRVFWAGDGGGLGFRFGGTSEQIVTASASVPDGTWFFVECAWDVAQQVSSMRINGQAWIRKAAPGVMVPTAGVQFVVGHHQTQSTDPERYQDTIDQVFITNRFEADVYQYRYSDTVQSGPPMHPPIPEDGSISFYYSCDWLDQDRAPEIGEGVLTRGTGCTLIPGVVNLAIDGNYETVRFQTDQNLDGRVGTMGFWVYTEEGKGNVYAMYCNSRFRLQLATNFSFNYASPWFNFSRLDMHPWGWNYVEIAWDTPNTRVSGRVNNGEWFEDVNPAYDMDATAGIGTYIFWGDQTNTGLQSPIDQVLISPNYQENMWQYRYSTQVGGPAPPQPGIPDDGTVSFYWSADWLDSGRAPELGQGVQQTASPGGELIAPKVGTAAYKTAFPATSWDAAGNIDHLLGTIGFWVKNMTSSATQNLIRWTPGGDAYRLYFHSGSSTFRLRCGNQEVQAAQPGSEGDWFFLEFAWDVAGNRMSWRVNGGAWTLKDDFTLADLGPMNSTWTLGNAFDGHAAGDVFEIDQVLIAPTYEYDLYQWRDTTAIGEPEMPPEPEPPEPEPGPPIKTNQQLSFGGNSRVDVPLPLVGLNNHTISYELKVEPPALPTPQIATGTQTLTEATKYGYAITSSLTRESGFSGVHTRELIHDKLYLDVTSTAAPGISTGVTVTYSGATALSAFNAAYQLRMRCAPIAVTDDGGFYIAGPAISSANYSDRIILCSSMTPAELDEWLLAKPSGTYIGETTEGTLTLRHYSYVDGKTRYWAVSQEFSPGVIWLTPRSIFDYWIANGHADDSINELSVGFATDGALSIEFMMSELVLPIDPTAASPAELPTDNTECIWGTSDAYATNQGWQSSIHYDRNGNLFSTRRRSGRESPFIRMPAGDWVHVREVYDAANAVAYIYFNNEFATLTVLPPIVNTTDDFIIGGNTGVETLFPDFSGTIRNVLVDLNGTQYAWKIEGEFKDQDTVPAEIGGVDGVLTLGAAGVWSDWEVGTGDIGDGTPPPPPDTSPTALYFFNDTYVTTPVTLNLAEAHYISYEVAIGEDATNRSQDIWATEDALGTGKLSRTRVVAGNALRFMRADSDAPPVEVALPIDSFVHVEEYFEPIDATSGRVYVRVDGVLRGSALVGAGTTTSAVTIGGSVLNVDTNTSFNGVIQNFRTWSGTGVAQAHWELRNILYHTQILDDLIASAKAQVVWGAAYRVPWTDVPAVADPPATPASGTIPDVTGLTVMAANAAITGAGMVVGTTPQDWSDVVPSGQVFGQSPPPGFAETGTTVNYTVSQGVDPGTYQTVFDNTIITLPISLSNAAGGYLEYEIRIDESGSDRAQKIWGCGDTLASGRLSRINLEANNALRPMRDSVDGPLIETGMQTGVWYLIREAMFPGTTPYCVLNLDTKDLTPNAVVGAGRTTSNLTIGGLLSSVGTEFKGSIRNVKRYSSGYALINHWPLDEEIVEGGTVRDIVGNVNGTVTRLGSGVSEARDAALPGFPVSGGSEAGQPPFPIPAPVPPDGHFLVFGENFETSPLDAEYKSSGATVVADPTGAGKGRVLKMEFTTSDLRPCSTIFPLDQTLQQASFFFDVYIDPADSDLWLAAGSEIVAKFPGAGGGTGERVGCRPTVDGFSCRAQLSGGQWQLVQYFEGREADPLNNGSCGLVAPGGVPAKSGWQTVRIDVDLGTPTQDGTYQIYVDGVGGGEFPRRWLAPGRSFEIDEFRWEVFVNRAQRGKPGGIPRTTVMYMTDLEVSSPQAPAGITQLVFREDTLLQVPVTLSGTQAHYVSYEIQPLESGTTRDQFVWSSEDTWGDGKTARARFSSGDTLRTARSEGSTPFLDVGLTVGELVHIEERFEPNTATAGTVYIKRNGVIVNQGTVGAGVDSSNLVFGGKLENVGTGASFNGVLRNIKIYDASAVLIHHWDVQNVTADGQTVPDLVGSADGTLSLGGGFAQPWDPFVPPSTPPDPPDTTAVPDLQGLTQTEAVAAITGAELVAGTQTAEYSSVVDTDYVISQTPAAGTAVDRGTTVDFIYSLGVEPTQFQLNFTNTYVRLPVQLNHNAAYFIEYDFKPLEAGSTRAQTIWASDDANADGRRASTTFEANNEMRPVRGSFNGAPVDAGISLNVWHTVRETYFPEGIDTIELVINSETQVPSSVTPQSRAASGDIILGGNVRNPARDVRAVLRNFKVYDDQFNLLHWYPMDAEYTANGNVVVDTVGGANGVVQAIGTGAAEPREAALPPIGNPEIPPPPDPPDVPPDPPPEEPPSTGIPPGAEVLFSQDFSSLAVGSRFNSPYCTIQNDDTGSGRGKVLRVRWPGRQLSGGEYLNPTYKLKRSAREVWCTYDCWIDPADFDDFWQPGLPSRIEGKMPGPSGGTGTRTGCNPAPTAFSARMYMRRGYWTQYQYWWAKNTSCARVNTFGDSPWNKMKPGWQTILLNVNLGTSTQDGWYQLWVDGQTDRRYMQRWIGPGQNFEVDEYRMTIFINASYPANRHPDRPTDMYFDNFVVYTL